MTNDNINKPSLNKQKKQQIVAEMAEKVAKAKAMVFTNYQGLTHHQLESLKRAVKKANAELTITKNTLLSRALKERKLMIEDHNFQQPTATLFVYEDIVLPLKEIAKSIKNFKLPIIKFGLFEGKLMIEQDIIRLSTLPTREVLLAQLVGGLKAPIFGLHRALNWNITKLVMTLKAIEAKKV